MDHATGTEQPTRPCRISRLLPSWQLKGSSVQISAFSHGVPPGGPAALLKSMGTFSISSVFPGPPASARPSTLSATAGKSTEATVVSTDNPAGHGDRLALRFERHVTIVWLPSGGVFLQTYCVDGRKAPHQGRVPAADRSAQQQLPDHLGLALPAAASAAPRPLRHPFP